jgi:hypothetical protein
LLRYKSIRLTGTSGTEELNRRNALEVTDPVYSQKLAPFVADRLTRAQDLGMGPYWEKLDMNVKAMLMKYLS